MNGKPVIHEFIVVEGRDDTTAINRSVIADTIETNGSALSQETIEKIRHAQELRGVIIFTDPDFPGEKIRKQIDSAVPTVNTLLSIAKTLCQKQVVALEWNMPVALIFGKHSKTSIQVGRLQKNNLSPKIFLFISVFLEERERKNAEKKSVIY